MQQRSRRGDEAEVPHPILREIRLPTHPRPYPAGIFVVRAEIRAHRNPVNRRLFNILLQVQQKVAGVAAGLFNAAFASSGWARGKGHRLHTYPLRLPSTLAPCGAVAALGFSSRRRRRRGAGAERFLERFG